MKKIFILCIVLVASIVHATGNSFLPEIQPPYTLVRPVLYKLHISKTPLTTPSEVPVITNVPAELSISELVMLIETDTVISKSRIESMNPSFFAGFFFKERKLVTDYGLKGEEIISSTRTSYSVTSIRIPTALIILTLLIAIYFILHIIIKRKKDKAALKKGIVKK